MGKFPAISRVLGERRSGRVGPETPREARLTLSNLQEFEVVDVYATVAAEELLD